MRRWLRRNLYLTTDPKEVKLIVIDITLLAYTGNQAIIERKNVAFKRAFALTAIATILSDGSSSLVVVAVRADGLLGEAKNDMSKKTPSNRADPRLSNLVLEGGKSKTYREARSGRFISRDSDGKFAEKTVVPSSPLPPGKGGKK